MRVAVTGGTGNVGSMLVERLAADPEFEHVVDIARRRPSSVHDGVEFRQADLGAEIAGPLLEGVDAVVHLAWLFQPSHSPATTWAANVLGTERVLRAAVDGGVRTVVHASSVGAYSPSPGSRRVDEHWPTHGIPTASYSVEKAYVERMLDHFERDRDDTRVVRLRPAFILRAAASVAQRRIFGGPLVPARTIVRTGLPVLPDPGIRFQALRTEDVVEAYRLALLADVRGAFNIATDPVVTMGDLAVHLGARTVRVPYRLLRGAVAAAWAGHLVPASPGMLDMMRSIPLLDSTRARRELGWAPRYDPEDALAALFDGLRSGAGGDTPPLDPATSGRLRVHELAAGVGERP